MLVETEGRNYTAAEYSDWLTEVGFVDPQVVPFEAPGANGVVPAVLVAEQAGTEPPDTSLASTRSK